MSAAGEAKARSARRRAIEVGPTRSLDVARPSKEARMSAAGEAKARSARRRAIEVGPTQSLAVARPSKEARMSAAGVVLRSPAWPR
jgi:hypothetical protein